MQVEELPRDVTDRPGRVVPALQHLDHMSDRALQQLDQLGRRRALAERLELGDDRPRFLRPRHAGPVVKEPPRPQSTINLHADLTQIPAPPRRDEPHLALDISVAIQRRAHDATKRRLVQRSEELVGRLLRSRHTRPSSPIDGDGERSRSTACFQGFP